MPGVSIALLLLHGGVKFFYYPLSLQKLSGLITYVGFIGAGAAAVVFLAGGGGSIGKKLRRRIYEKKGKQYQYFKSMHNLTFLLSVIVFVHVYSSSMAEYTPFLKGYFVVVFLAGAAGYGYHKVIRPRRLPFYSVSEVLTPSDKVTTLRFNLEKGSEISHAPGQFAFFRFPGGNPGPEEHPFTISGFPEVEITAKAVGDFTGALSRVESGTLVRIDGPYGVFSCRNYSGDMPRVFIAGGIGITPFLSMLRALHRDGENHRPLIIWGVKTAEDLVYLEEVRRGGELFEIVEENDGPEGRHGRIDRKMLEEILSGELVERALFLVCGPPLMMKSVIRDLKSLGVRGRRIIVERFSL